MKKYKIIIGGMISLIIFGLILPQPIQALLVLVDSPIKDFYAAHTILLCVTVGIIQGACEEIGYFYVFKHVLNKYHSEHVPIQFGVGRSILEFLYNVVAIVVTQVSALNIIIRLFARLFGFGGTIGLSILDYTAMEPKKKHLLLISICFHAILNGVLYSIELGLISNANNLESWFMIIVSALIMFYAFIIYKRKVDT